MQQNGSAQSAQGPSAPRPKVEPLYVRFVGDSVGVVNLTPNALQFLADQVTNVLMRTVVSSKSFALHGRRTTLTSEDLEIALKQHKLPIPLDTGHRRPHLRQITMPSNGEELYVREDYDVELSTILEESHPKVPLKTSLKAHWLALDGKLAIVPENVRSAKEEEDDDLTSPEEVKAAAIAARRETAGGTCGASVSFRATSRQVDAKEQFQIKPPVIENLSVEQQLYLKDIVEAIVGVNDEKRQSALYSLEVDTGLQPILPKFSRLIFHAIRCNVLHRCLSMLIYLVRIVRSLSMNQSVKLVGVLHELIPSLLSCMVGRALCSRPDVDNHWALRDFAGKTLGQLLRDHGVVETKDRALRAVRKVWDDPKSTYPMLYGCILPLVEWTTSSDPARLEIHQRVLELLQETSPANQANISTQRRVQQLLHESNNPANHQSILSLARHEAGKLHQQLLRFEPILKKSVSSNGLPLPPLIESS